MAFWTRRKNGDDVHAGWWNDILDWLTSFLGGGAIVETDFTFTNAQVAAADVTALVFAKASYRAAFIRFSVRRKTDTGSSEVVALHLLSALYNTQADSWSIYDEKQGDDDGITFSITTSGQVQYTSSDITGSNGIHTGRFRAETFDV